MTNGSPARARVRAAHLDSQAKGRTVSGTAKPPTSLYDAIVPPYIAFARQHRGRRTTHQLENVLGRFFSWVDDRSVADVRDLTPAQIREFISSLEHFRSSTIATHASALRGLFGYLRLQGVLHVDLCYAVETPRLYRMSKPPEVLDDKTMETLLAAVDRSTSLGKRDYAILLLAARYGLRPSDIRGLRFENVYWSRQLIVLIQSKTQRPLELPLLADVDEALVEYVRNGRPPCAAREIFVRHVQPITPLTYRNNLWRTMDRALCAAGIELPWPRRGLCLLRHSAATRMLRNGVRIDTISDVLGHASVDTTRRYAQVDVDGLRSVAMSETEVRR